MPDLETPDREPQVPQFRDLHIACDPGNFHTLADAVDALVRSPWHHYEHDIGSASREFRAWRREPGDGLPELRLFLAEFTDGLKVANIVPSGGSLSIADYNRVLLEFHSHFLRRAATELGLTATVSSDVLDMRSAVGVTAYRELLEFSRLANRSTGSAHPMDKDRWFDFIVAVDRQREPGATAVKRWLVADGWPDEQADDLAVEYEFGIGLLNRANGR